MKINPTEEVSMEKKNLLDTQKISNMDQGQSMMEMADLN